MQQLEDILKQRAAASTILELTSVFESIASMRMAQIKDQVQRSEKFFGELWQIYSQIRVDEFFHFGRLQSMSKIIDKELLILMTSEGSLSGDIDLRLVNEAQKYYQPDKHDITVIGRHGAGLLTQKGMAFVRSFKMPERDNNIHVAPLAAQVQNYAATTVFYESYKSLMVQEVKTLKLSAAVEERGRGVKPGSDIITEENYIFEPSTYDVINHLENSMMQITLSELVLESKLAQYASRFRAMSAAEQKSQETVGDLNTLYNRARRHIKDERLKEVFAGIMEAER